MPSQRGQAGAETFVEPHGDNSIPTFGVEASKVQRHRAEAALRFYLAARAAGAWNSACDRIAAPLVLQLEELGSGRSCAATYRALYRSSPRSDPLRGQLVSLRRKGQRAFALFLGPAGHKFVIPLAREKGVWKVTRLAPFPYPLG